MRGYAALRRFLRVPSGEDDLLYYWPRGDDLIHYWYRSRLQYITYDKRCSIGDH